MHSAINKLNPILSCNTTFYGVFFFSGLILILENSVIPVNECVTALRAADMWVHHMQTFVG